MKKVYIETLGCKVNQYESAAILDLLIKKGFASTNQIDEADVLILNSCTVTNRTDYKSRNVIRHFLKLKEADPNKIVIVSGCYVQREKAQAEELGNIDAIIDNNNKSAIPDLVEKLLLHNAEPIESCQQAQDFLYFDELPSSSMGEKSRAFIKIQDGCNFYCSYCAIPYARGNPRSRMPESIIAQVEEMIKKGYHEFVLAGINQGLYGIDFSERNTIANTLAELIQAICDIPGYKKIRLSSVEPQLFTEDLIKVICENEQVCPHFHIPLQSGSDSILQAMRRKYDTRLFSNLVKEIISKRADAAFGFDVIVGFPGETNELFAETLNFLKSLPLTYLHVFIYSKRRGTVAAKLPNQVHGNAAKERSQALISLSHEKIEQYTKKLVDIKAPLLCIVEGSEEGVYYGMTDHFVRVKFKANKEAVNKGDLVKLKAIKADGEQIIAEIW
ncbi:MAG TPA: tRNA (N(6)-L-threonylcarbamoyladenosine(37)-C(2))-methylthiotransferase MtaB [Candidatus Cloacimonadota bacterium]|nr:tRNA (N(6)-L-threonylcarbamoyladenosine(37)-C(2))-methylthiotransferase MtaB [Candidatus Cloacimonadales bacterium]HPY96526.1 tRNA (N(6)-L-threonylcarbamoyladenosine(37)-C(2))-methylthiotransferase MtaB [Candidatus Cloacimonadota bacterium]HQB40635.1 tRNA (N(6)-L-threonylcarbamoyladenosine(37)-C(2))-methylthiotransferase MtaB [Candidatus Cloacimonadota bacterium]